MTAASGGQKLCFLNGFIPKKNPCRIRRKMHTLGSFTGFLQILADHFMSFVDI